MQILLSSDLSWFLRILIEALPSVDKYHLHINRFICIYWCSANTDSKLELNELN